MGLVGSVAGGFVLEKIKAGATATAAEAAGLAALLMLVSFPFCIGSFMLTTTSKLPFFAMMTVAQFFLFAKEGPVNSAMLWSVSDDLKPHAMAFSMLLAHFLGDIPSPPILGAILDATADFSSSYACREGTVANGNRTKCVIPPTAAGREILKEASHCATSSLAGCALKPGFESYNLTSCHGKQYCLDLPCIAVEGSNTMPNFNSHGDYRLVMGYACAWLMWPIVLWYVAKTILQKQDEVNSKKAVRQRIYTN
eukprot:SAG31_NODE_3312_length_4432_cov_2.870298_5_plen_252_part_01